MEYTTIMVRKEALREFNLEKAKYEIECNTNISQVEFFDIILMGFVKYRGGKHGKS